MVEVIQEEKTCIPSELKDQGVNRGVLAILVRITTIPGATIGSRLRRAPYGTDSVDIRLDSVWLPRTRYYGRSPYTVILLAEYIEVGTVCGRQNHGSFLGKLFFSRSSMNVFE